MGGGGDREEVEVDWPRAAEGEERRTAQLLKADPRLGGRRRLRDGRPKRRWDWVFKELLGDRWQDEAADRETWWNWGKEAVLMVMTKLDR